MHTGGSPGRARRRASVAARSSAKGALSKKRSRVIPIGRLHALARFANTAKASVIRRLPESRRLATLVAFAGNLEAASLDDALDLLDILLTEMFSDAARESDKARLQDLPTSLCANLIAEACNIGLEPLTRHDVPALRRVRLSWVNQNFIRNETLVDANARLVAEQNKIPLVQQWGGGEVASADGLRFVVPVRTLRDSLYLLSVVLEQQPELYPTEIMTDTGAYTDVVFDCFGYWATGSAHGSRTSEVPVIGGLIPPPIMAC